MKNIIKSLMIGLAAVALLASCEDKDKNVEIDPYATNWIYLEKPSMTAYNAMFTASSGWVLPFDSLQTVSRARCTKPAPADVKVTMKIDESLVAAYNDAHATDYEFLTGVVLEKNTLTIPKGEYVSVDTVKVVHNSDHQDLTANGTKTYLLPVVIDSYNGSLTKSEQSVVYLTYSATEVIGHVVKEYVGTEIDKANWHVTYDGADITSVVKGSGYRTIRQGGEIIVDFGAMYDVKTFGVEFDWSISYAGKSFTLAYSEDGVNYTEAGEYFNDPVALAVIVEFFDSVPCRYFKVVMGPPVSYSSDLQTIRATSAN